MVKYAVVPFGSKNVISAVEVTWIFNVSPAAALRMTVASVCSPSLMLLLEPATSAPFKYKETESVAVAPVCGVMPYSIK